MEHRQLQHQGKQTPEMLGTVFSMFTFTLRQIWPEAIQEAVPLYRQMRRSVSGTLWMPIRGEEKAPLFKFLTSEVLHWGFRPDRCK